MNAANTAIWKTKLIDSFGGGCQRCGYRRCQQALQFHHLVERIDKPGRANLTEVESFPERFELLCANCHIEEHNRMHLEAATMTTCDFCGKVFRTVSYKLLNNRAKFCSRTCHKASEKAEAIRPENVAARFWSHVDKTDGCWNWLGHINPQDRRGRFAVWRNGKWTVLLVHRFSYELLHGHPPFRPIRMSCGNLICVNPDHF